MNYYQALAFFVRKIYTFPERYSFKPRQVCSYSSIKETVGEVLESIETFVSKENFKNHIRPDGYNMEEIEESLELRRKDLAKTDCSVIVAGTFLNKGKTLFGLILNIC